MSRSRVRQSSDNSLAALHAAGALGARTVLVTEAIESAPAPEGFRPDLVVPLLADLPATFATPELRVECPDDVKFAVVERAAAHFAARYPVATLDGVRITFPDGWGLLRASNTQPVLVMRFEATSEQALAAYRREVEGWLAHNTTAPPP